MLVLVATLTIKGHMWLKQKLQRSYEQQQKTKMTLFIICLTFIENLRSSSLCDNVSHITFLRWKGKSFYN